MLLLNSPIGFFSDPIPHSAEALMVHEVCNKGFTKPVLDLFATCGFIWRACSTKTLSAALIAS
jgi:hypothetical protein